MCSRTRGPARLPSLVTWPTMNTEVPVSLAKRTIAPALCRTCDTLPGALALSWETMVWMESMMSTSGCRRPHFSSTLSTSFSVST